MTAEGEPAEVEHYHGHRERLRTRFRDGGAEAVADYELIELILFRAIPVSYTHLTLPTIYSV